MSETADVRFEELVRRYGRLISAVVARVARGGLAASRDDVEQKVLFSLWKRLCGEQTIDPSSSYVYRAAVREAVRAVREAVGRAEDPLAEEGVEQAGPEPDPFATLASKERLAQIEGAMAALPLDRRRAVRAHLAGFDVDEIMRLHGWPYQKARNLIARGMADLRRTLTERGIHG
jgi:RNA polymerase sigma factor (sigma-70 family)